jgi:S-(hydroxymethyl)glutathione dehydrogenase/alcohol dehydrogenase
MAEAKTEVVDIASGKDTTGKIIKCKAAVAWKANDLQIEDVEVGVPKATEVRIRLHANGVCHTDWSALVGQDSEVKWPVILGHEGAGVVESVGKDVTSVKVGDKVIPLYIPECRTCKFCLSGKTNLCSLIRTTQGAGLMPDGTSRFTCKGQQVFHFMGTSCFSQVTVCPEISVAKIADDAPLEKVCLLACGFTTGYGAPQNSCKVTKGSNAAVFGLGGVGLACVQGVALMGAKRIIAIDTNPKKFDMAKKFGATDVLNPLTDVPAGKTIQQVIVDMTDGGVDYSFECVGNVQVMRSALECCHKGWGESCIIGVAPSGTEISTRPFQLVTGRVWRGSAFGGVKGRTQLPLYVQQYMQGKLQLDDFISQTLTLNDSVKAFKLLEEGNTIRTVLKL